MNVDEKIKAMKEAPCSYPHCEKKQLMSVSLPVIKVLEGGKIEPVEGMGLVVPWCDYHFTMASSGLIVIEQTDKGDKLHGPFELIHIVETVLQAGAFAKKMGRKK